MTEDEKPLERLIEEAERAHRYARILDAHPAANDLRRYAEELDAEIRRRTVVTAQGSASAAKH